MCYKIKRFFTSLQVAIHKPYMLIGILTTRCPQCKRWFSFPKIEIQNTLYSDKYSNYFCGCRDCQEYNANYWEDKWNEVYSSNLYYNNSNEDLF